MTPDVLARQRATTGKLTMLALQLRALERTGQPVPHRLRRERQELTVDAWELAANAAG